MKRRDFITLVGSAAAWPLAARAQQSSMPVIGFLGVIQLAERPKAALRQGLAEQGFVEGRNIAIEFRFTEGRYDRMPEMAAELVRLPATVIVASPTPPAMAAKAATATTTVPLVLA